MRNVARETKVLSVNSTYFYALMSRHFQQTCLVAESKGQLCGYVIGYHPPEQPDTLFIWQIGVACQYQKKGLGKKMLTHLIKSTQPDYLEATIAQANHPSINLFKSVARQFGAQHNFSKNPFFDDEDLGAAEQAEHLMRIGSLV